jgi:hypothetical protein
MRHRGQKRFEAARAVVPFTIDKETWRPIDSGTHSALEIFPNTLGMSARNHFLNETHFVQAERGGVFASDSSSSASWLANSVSCIGQSSLFCSRFGLQPHAQHADEHS